MDDGLKQRLVGAIVLLGAAVIFIPTFLDGPDQGTTGEVVEVPERPKFEVISPIVKDVEKSEQAMRERLERERAEYVAEAKSEPAKKPDPVTSDSPQKKSEVKEAKAIAKKSVEKKAPAKEVTKVSGQLAKAWTIQLASFTKKTNADELERKLLSQKYRAYSEPVDTDKGVVYRVFVGPDLKKERAEQALGQLQKDVGLSGLVIRYQP